MSRVLEKFLCAQGDWEIRLSRPEIPSSLPVPTWSTPESHRRMKMAINMQPQVTKSSVYDKVEGPNFTFRNHLSESLFRCFISDLPLLSIQLLPVPAQYPRYRTSLMPQGPRYYSDDFINSLLRKWNFSYMSLRVSNLSVAECEVGLLVVGESDASWESSEPWC